MNATGATPDARPPAGLRLRAAVPGEGRGLARRLDAWLGTDHASTMRSLDRGELLDGDVLELVLVAESPGVSDGPGDTAETVGVLVAGPSASYYGAFPRQHQDAVMQLVAKVVAVAVAPDHRHRGVASALLARAVTDYQSRGYAWMYGQFDVSSDLTSLYRRAGFTVAPEGQPLHAPPEAGGAVLAPLPGERWFHRRLWT